MGILSLYFLVFLTAVVGVYYLVPGKLRVYVILAANVVFYAQFGLSSGMLFLTGILCAYFCGRLLGRASAQNVKKVILGLGLLYLIGLLVCTKFCWGRAQTLLGLSVAIPVGISFYTLQLCSYLIDVYREKSTPEKNVLKFAAYSGFFPLILQGPISRYHQLAPQLFSAEKKRGIYHNVTFGAQRMLWGYFKKLVIADRAAILVNGVFGDYGAFSGRMTLFAVVLYMVQLYTDFSGCVDICSGAAQMMGISVTENFKRPYFAKSISEYWRRWHLSLSGWLRDYVYIPLGGNRKGTLRQYFNILIVFIISGLWHGTGVNYLVWGLGYAFFQIVGNLLRPTRKRIYEAFKIPTNAVPVRVFQCLVTFLMVTFLQTFLRAESVRIAFTMLGKILTDAAGASTVAGFTSLDAWILLGAVAALFCVSLYQEKGGSVRVLLEKRMLPVRWFVYLGLIALVLLLGIYGPGYLASEFIYMNF